MPQLRRQDAVRRALPEMRSVQLMDLLMFAAVVVFGTDEELRCEHCKKKYKKCKCYRV